MKINPLTCIDFYKADHRRQYPEGTTEVYSNLTPRKNIGKFPGDQIVFFGLQYFIKHFLIDTWNNEFFKKDKQEVINNYKKRMDTSLGKDAIETTHIEKLHDLGYLPIAIRALSEGMKSNFGVPVLTIENTHPEFFWLTNYLETILSCYLWKPITNATIAWNFKKMLTQYANATGTDKHFVNFQLHDFSFRGMSSLQDAALSGAAHLLSFLGTDTVPAIDLLEDYYFANPYISMIGGSVSATEHSVMCMGTKEKEFETYKNLIENLYPTGILSIVSDTWNLWKVIMEYLPQLKDSILKRDGKIVIRPDSGDPVKIICGDPKAEKNTPQFKGVIECLWEIFGGDSTSMGYKLLNSKIGVIYGDAISYERAQQILKCLMDKGFASGNIVFGVGSYTYQYNTRDTFGLAIKATHGIVKGKGRSISKDPITDNGTKKSAEGYLKVTHAEDKTILHQNQPKEELENGLLRTVFENGNLYIRTNLDSIRALLYYSEEAPSPILIEI